MRPESRAATVFLGILTTIFLGWVLHLGAEILQPLVIALLVAIMLQPVVNGLARVGIPPLLTVILIVALLFFGVAVLGMTVESHIRAFFAEDGRPSIPDIISSEQEEVMERAGGWDAVVHQLQVRLQDTSLPVPLVNYTIDTLKDERGVAAGLIGSGFGFSKNLILVLIYMVFIFAEQAIFRRKILSIAGDRREDAEQVLDTIGQGIQRYLGIKTIISLVTAALCYSVLVALNVPWALLFGVLTFLLNYIPTFGSIIAALFPTLTVLALDGSPGKAALVIGFYLAINLALGSYVEPKVLGRELDLSPLVIVLSVVVWGTLWGVVGAFLAVPMTSALQIMLASQDNTRPLAVLLSSGPPRERWRIPGRPLRRVAQR